MTPETPCSPHPGSAATARGEGCPPGPSKLRPLWAGRVRATPEVWVRIRSQDPQAVCAAPARALTVCLQGGGQQLTALVAHGITGDRHRGKRGDPRGRWHPGQFWPLAAGERQARSGHVYPHDTPVPTRKASNTATIPPHPGRSTLTAAHGPARLRSSPPCPHALCLVGQRR